VTRDAKHGIKKMSKPVFDRKAFEILFRSHFKGMCYFAMQYVKDYESAREIVQEAFISLLEKRVFIDPEKQVKSYLSATVHNRCLNFLRDNKRFNGDLLSLEHLYPEQTFVPPDKLVEKEMQKKIRIAMEELPEKCREIFHLNRFEHLKYQEVADKLGISVKTVETQMSKALQHMRIHLKEYLAIILLLKINL
jgi:RNA polymerase sigma-70 factor, ECF subfamily